jgi:hypothetical protein
VLIQVQPMPIATPLWSRVPHAGFYINSVAISADGEHIVAGTFFHDYGSSASAQATGGEAKLAGRVAAALPSSAATPAQAGSGPSQYGTFGTYVWNRAGELLMQQEFDGWQGVYWVAMAGDASVVASCGWRSGSPNYAGFIAAYVVGTGASLLEFALPGRGNVVALDSHARLLLAGADQGYLFARTPNGDFSAPPSLFPLTAAAAGDTALVTALDAAAGAGLVASYHGEVILFGISQGVPTQTLRWQVPNSAYLHFAALSADGRWAFAGANNGLLFAFNVDKCMAAGALAPAWQVQIPGGATTIYGVACSADGGRIGVAGNVGSAGSVSVFHNMYSHAALIWTASTARSPNSVSFDATGSALALADGHPDGTPGDFYLWNAASGELLWSFPTSDMSWPIQLSADGSTVAAGSDNGSVYAFDGAVAG